MDGSHIEINTDNERENRPPYHLLIESLVSDERRNALVAQDAVSALRASRFPLLISDRKEHMDRLERLIKEQASNDKDLSNLRIIRLDGSLTAKQRRAAIKEIGRTREAGAPTLIIATASLIGEGFDLPDLDTLVLSMPLSFEGRMIQYAGRLHRLSEKKSDVLIYDYLDSSNAMLLKMYRNRLKAYRKMGYVVQQMQRELISVVDCQ